MADSGRQYRDGDYYMKKDIKFMLGVARNVRYIARSPTFLLPRDEMVRLYIRVKTKQWLMNRFHKVILPPEEVLGIKIDYTHFNTFCYLLDEVFIRQQYYFVSERQDPLIIDCGSNIGMSIVYFKILYPESRIVAFEPYKEAFDKLRNNVESNKIENVDIYHKAIYNKEGTIDFFYNPEHIGSLRMSTSRDRLKIETVNIGLRKVESVLLSSYIQEMVDLLKMDVEGAELGVIVELANRNKLNMIKELIVEYHHHIKKEDDRLSEMLKILEDHRFGYQIRSELALPYKKGKCQDILIYAYQKSIGI